MFQAQFKFIDCKRLTFWFVLECIKSDLVFENYVGWLQFKG